MRVSGELALVAAADLTCSPHQDNSDMKLCLLIKMLYASQPMCPARRLTEFEATLSTLHRPLAAC